jgi:multimeric flavodoxin WrbA
MKKILVIYHSQEYGNTEACAKLVARGAQEVGGVEVKLINTNVMQRVDMSELAACDGVAFGSPDYGSYVAGTIKQIFDDIYVANKSGLAIASKPCVLFMTHGGGGKGIERSRAWRVALPWWLTRSPARARPRKSASRA